MLEPLGCYQRQKELSSRLSIRTRKDTKDTMSFLTINRRLDQFKTHTDIRNWQNVTTQFNHLNTVPTQSGLAAFENHPIAQNHEICNIHTSSLGHVAKGVVPKVGERHASHK